MKVSTGSQQLNTEAFLSILEINKGSGTYVSDIYASPIDILLVLVHGLRSLHSLNRSSSRC